MTGQSVLEYAEGASLTGFSGLPIGGIRPCFRPNTNGVGQPVEAA